MYVMLHVCIHICKLASFLPNYPYNAWVAYPRPADNVSRPFLFCLYRVTQPVIGPRNVFATLLPSLLADGLSTRLPLTSTRIKRRYFLARAYKNFPDSPGFNGKILDH